MSKPRPQVTRDYRKRLAEAGLREIQVTIPSECEDEVRAFVAKLRLIHEKAKS